MDGDNLIFSGKISSQVEDLTYDILLRQFSDKDYNKVYVQSVTLAGKEILFFVEIDGTESIIRIRVEND